MAVKQYIDPNKNILEIGGHCGSSTIVYANYLNSNRKVYVYEPQRKQYNILRFNTIQNNLEDKIVAFNNAVFCKNMNIKMNNIDIDGGREIVSKCYNNSNLLCNFGGIGLGVNGEDVKAVVIDDMNHIDIGFIHFDIHIFSNAKNLIKNNRPVILYENNKKYNDFLYNNVCNSYPEFNEYSNFDLEEYCMKELKYSKVIHRFCDGSDDLLIP